MGIDPKSLAAFAAPNQGKRKEADPAPASDEVELDAEPEAADEDFVESGTGRFGKLIPLLEEHVEVVQEAADNLSPTAYDDLGEELSVEDGAVLQESFEMADDKLQKELRASCADIALEDCQRLADHLLSEGLLEDSERVAGWLFLVGRHVLGE